MIFIDSSFDKPFFLTHLSTSLFSIYLLGFLFLWKQWTSNLGFQSKQYTSLNESKGRYMFEDYFCYLFLIFTILCLIGAINDAPFNKSLKLGVLVNTNN